MYKVIKHFIDLHDNDHSYNEGDIFPREEEMSAKKEARSWPAVTINSTLR